jgi:hypothetical protein
VARLPQPGGDNGIWGQVLNDYLSQTLKSDGSLKDNVVTTTAIAPDAITGVEIANGTIQESQLSTDVQTKLNTVGSGTIADDTVSTPKLQNGSVTVAKLADGAITNIKIAPAAAIDQSKIANLTSDLGTKAPTVHTHTVSQISDSTATGRSLVTAADGGAAKSALSLAKSDVGLGNVDNTSDATKNSAAATFTNKIIDGGSNTLQNIPQSAISGLATSLAAILPAQSTHAGKFLTTNGSAASWAQVRQSELHYLVYSEIDGWPTRPADSLPVLWVGGAAPDDAPAQLSSGVGDVWIPATGDGESTGLVEANTQTASYTLTLADVGKCVEMNLASANNLTIPPVSSAAFPIGSVIEVLQLGAGQTTLVAGSGVTLRAAGSRLKLAGQYSSAALRMRASNEWAVVGDLTS